MVMFCPFALCYCQRGHSAAMSWFRLALRLAFIAGLIVIGTIVFYLPLLQPLPVLLPFLCPKGH